MSTESDERKPWQVYLDEKHPGLANMRKETRKAFVLGCVKAARSVGVCRVRALVECETNYSRWCAVMSAQHERFVQVKGMHEVLCVRERGEVATPVGDELGDVQVYATGTARFSPGPCIAPSINENPTHTCARALKSVTWRLRIETIETFKCDLFLGVFNQKHARTIHAKPPHFPQYPGVFGWWSGGMRDSLGNDSVLIDGTSIKNHGGYVDQHCFFRQGADITLQLDFSQGTLSVTRDVSNAHSACVWRGTSADERGDVHTYTLESKDLGGGVCGSKCVCGCVGGCVCAYGLYVYWTDGGECVSGDSNSVRILGCDVNW
eukprot:GDKI01033502.1.p1 GENE.GDKI01033502.1~~GDKI01033502.1.p1  ORF type:complete len:320 (-),score=91.56 GDKI01033502.1:321-1280(-)